MLFNSPRVAADWWNIAGCAAVLGIGGISDWLSRGCNGDLTLAGIFAASMLLGNEVLSHPTAIGGGFCVKDYSIWCLAVGGMTALYFDRWRCNSYFCSYMDTIIPNGLFTIVGAVLLIKTLVESRNVLQCCT